MADRLSSKHKVLVYSQLCERREGKYTVESRGQPSEFNSHLVQAGSLPAHLVRQGLS